MAGHGRRGSHSSSSSSSSSSTGTGTWRRTPPEQHGRFAWSPAWSRPLSEEEGGGRDPDRRSRAASLRSLFRSIGLWFSSVSNFSAASCSSSSSSTRKKNKKIKELHAPADDAIKKPPLLPAGHTTGGRPSVRGLYSGSGYRNGSSRERHQQAGFQSSVFSMEDILRATSNFSPALKIGQGGFGSVYKGVLPNGTVVAVKRAKQRMQNPHVDVEFRSEVKIMARIEHQSLVRFYGYLECGEERVVVVEHVPNGTLRDHLDGSESEGKTKKVLDLGTRLDIAIDVAHAVTYLHMYSDHPIIHRDIKSSNILLTDSLRAKVADFGFARLGAGGLGADEATHVSTQVKGTAGYLDPEYLKTCQLTDRSDVYSFGVLLVELASARRPIETKREMRERLTARWAMAKFINGAAADVLDPCLPRTPAAEKAIHMLLELAFRCMGPVRNDRPAMSECCRVLWAIRKKYRDDMLALTAADHNNHSDSDRHTTGDLLYWRR